VEDHREETGGPKKRKKTAKRRAAPVPAVTVPADGERATKKGELARGLAIGVIGLVAGGLAGWFVRDARATPAVAAGPDPASQGAPADAAGTSGPCDSWSQQLCAKAGAESEGCAQARSAAGLLPAGACTAALAELPATLDKLKNARSSCDELMTKLCNDLGPDTQTCGMVKEKTPSMPASACKDMLGTYDRVLGELKQMEKQNAPISAEEAQKQRAGDGPAFGPAEAKLAIVEYSDFECPYCSQAAEAVKKIKEKYGKDVRFVFRQFPLSFHENAQLAAEASLAAHAQGKFWPYHDLLFANQKKLDRQSLESYAEQVGLDMAKFKKALDEHTYAGQVKADMALGEQLGVSGTPTMVVGTERVPNPTDFDAISALVDKQLKATPEAK
jgi:protein-disulfide isomerase